MKEQLSFRAYAKRRGVSHTAVQKAVKTGRLRRALLTVGSRVLVDPAIADREWSASTDPMQQRDEAARSGGAPRGTRPANAGRPRQGGLYGKDTLEAAADGEGETAEPKGPNLTRLRAFDMSFRAQLTKLELEERTGQLVRASAVTAEAFRLGRSFRDAMRGVARLAVPIHQGEPDARAFEHRMDELIVRTLDRFVAQAGAANQPAGGGASTETGSAPQ